MTKDKKPKEYGFLISGTIGDEGRTFTKFLSCNVGAINFGKTEEKDLGDYSFMLKTADNISITAIGHGYEEDEFINEKTTKHTVVTIIKDVKDKLDKISNELKLKSSLTEKVSNFRLQVCHQGKHVLAKKDEIKQALGSYNSSYPISFSCPAHYSHLDWGKTGVSCYKDSNAKSPKDYEKKEADKSLETGNKYTYKISIEQKKLLEESRGK